MNTEPIPFWKLSASGNDFICIDNRDGRFDALLATPAKVGHFARTLCQRGHGVGADGVIFACRSEVGEQADLGARFIEADGSECELCGNGTGCFTHYVISSGLVPDREIKILTPVGVVLGQHANGRYVRVCIPSPEDTRCDLSLAVEEETFDCDYTVVGIPHLVTYVEDIAAVDVARWGRSLRHHPTFQPRGVNVNFVQVLAAGEIAIRTYEYGVEAETLSCGTGSSAAAILATLRFDWPADIRRGDRPVLVHAKGGDVLRVFLAVGDDERVEDVCLETVVRRTLHGSLHPYFAAEALNPPATSDHVQH